MASNSNTTKTKIIALCFIFSLISLSYVYGQQAMSASLQKEVVSSFPTKGTATDPRLIYTYDDLKKIKNDLAAVYRLMNDIDASASRTENYGQGFEPIGNFDVPFSGTFNGEGHIIRNLYINRPETNGVGLFGKTLSCKIDSLGLVNVDLTGDFHVGALVGNHGGTVSYCWSTGKINAYRDAGGLIGSNYYANSLTNSYSTCSVTGDRDLGGLVGLSIGPIAKCYATGNVSGNSYTGGLVGISWYEIDNSYATGNVSSNVKNDGYFGGLVGEIDSRATSYCYATGKVTTSKYSGGVTSATVNTGRTSCCYYDVMTTGLSECQYGIGLSTSQMRQQGLFWFWDFDITWNMIEGITYPAIKGINNAPFAFADTIKTSNKTVAFADMLKNDCDFETLKKNLTLKVEQLSAGSVGATSISLPQNASEGDVFTAKYRVGELLASGDTLWGNRADVRIICSLKGSGTESDPYLIYTYNDLNTVRKNLKAVYRLMNDIDASASKNENGGKGFATIGFYNLSSDFAFFNGTFHGGGHIISNLSINRPSSDNIGLFGYVSLGLIDSLGLVDVSVTGSSDVGGLIGMNNSGSVKHCYVTGNVSGNLIIVGGLVGANYGTITDCYTNCIIKSTQCVGGLIGYNSGNITGCRSSGSINCSNSTAGGLIGQSYSKSTISNCCSDVKVTCNNGAGGFIGDNQSVIKLCYSSGKVYCENISGGFTGYNGGTISCCYSTGTVSRRSMAAGFAGNNKGTISNCYATGVISGLTFIAGFCSDNRGTIDKCYATGWVSGNSLAAGHTRNNTGGQVSNCYYNTTTTSQKDTCGTPLTTSQMVQKKSFEGWDFSSVWDICEGKTYPVLRGIENAPFAFADSVKVNQIGLITKNVLKNDYDFETGTRNLVYYLSFNYGKGKLDGYGFFSFPLSTPVGTKDSLLCRVGEVVAPGDTLWGNYAWLKIINTDEIIRVAPEISWENPAPITYGKALDSLELSAVTGASGQLIYSPAEGTVLDAGAGQMLAVSFFPDDTIQYERATKTVTIDVNKALIFATVSDTMIHKNEELPTFNILYTGFVNGDEINDIDIRATATTSATSDSKPGEYVINVSGAEDNNYKFEYTSGILTIEDNTGIEDIRDFNITTVFPNPFTNMINMKTHGGNYRLTDLFGREIMKGKTKSGIDKLLLPPLNKGIYIFQLTTGSKLKTFRLVKSE
jgi:hypothetical protein